MGQASTPAPLGSDQRRAFRYACDGDVTWDDYDTTPPKTTRMQDPAVNYNSMPTLMTVPASTQHLQWMTVSATLNNIKNHPGGQWTSLN